LKPEPHGKERQLIWALISCKTAKTIVRMDKA